MNTAIKNTHFENKRNVFFNQIDAKGRVIGASVVAYSVTYENSATGFLSVPEGTLFMYRIHQMRDDKVFQSTMLCERFTTARARDAAIAIQLRKMQ